MRRGEDQRQRLTKRILDAAGPRAKRYVLWDHIPGFGLSITPTGIKTFILRYRPGRAGRAAPKRFIAIGRFGPLTIDQARQRALELLGQVAKGDDPAASARKESNSPTVAEAAREFLEKHVTPKRKPTTAAFYTHTVENKIVPAVGRRKLIDLSRVDVAHLHHSLRATPHMANRTIAVLGSLYSWAGKRGLVSEEFNPIRKLDKFRESRRERFLTTEEFARLGSALREAETVGIPYEVNESGPKAKHAPKEGNRRVVVPPDVTAAIRLLLLTGCRLREVLHLRWTEFDLQRGLLLLEDSKTGRKTVTLGAAAADILTQLPRVGEFVFPGSDCCKPRSDLKRPWKSIIRQAGLVGLRIHDLRHSYAAAAAGAGFGLLIIGKLLGHRQPSTTQRYAHLADDPVRWASDKIADQIAEALR